MKYTIISTTNRIDFVEDINELLAKGWKLHGSSSAVVTSEYMTRYVQALTYTEPRSVRVKEPKIPNVLPTTLKGRHR